MPLHKNKSTYKRIAQPLFGTPPGRGTGNGAAEAPSPV